jgi:hypothetical protein
MNIKLKRLIRSSIVLYFFLNISTINAQNIQISANNKSLDKILIELRDNYAVQFSYNPSVVATNFITLNAQFTSVGEALTAILKQTNLQYELSDNVYVVFPKRINKEPVSLKEYILAGSIFDGISGETLPYTQLIINNYALISGSDGTFVYKTTDDSLFRVRINYLGYYMLDTIVKPSKTARFSMNPAFNQIDEIRITGSSISYSTQIGSQAGMLRVNQKVANYLPGNGDNAVFNLLRLQPGILAAGEYSSDLIIWGSYKGQSLLTFDGFRVFGQCNFNDNISAINPFLAKDIQVLKAGYGASYGNVVGGIVNIEGIEGKQNKHDINLNINNNTITGLYSFPVGNKTTVILAMRKTYFDLYQPQALKDLVNLRKKQQALADIPVNPDYYFYDFNAKITTKLDEQQKFYVTFYNSKDRFFYDLNYDGDYYHLYNSLLEQNHQQAFAANYNYRDKDGNAHEFIVSHSALDRSFTDSSAVVRILTGKLSYNKYDKLFNTIDESSLKWNNTSIYNSNSQWLWGFEALQNKVILLDDSMNINIQNREHQGYELTAYMSHLFHLDSTFEIETGLRTTYFNLTNKDVWMPRISIRYKVNNFRYNFSGGTYSQALVENLQIDKFGNMRYKWMLADNKYIPIVNSRHLVLGANYSAHGFSVNTELFLKNTDGLARYLSLDEGILRSIGISRSYGVDVFLKKEYKGSSAWISYTYSYAQEHFPYFINQYWKRSLQDQRHEIKMATLINLHPFYLGMNYVWGSGFPDPTPFIADIYTEKPYNRFDVSAIYRLSRDKFKMELGFSLLNVFDYQNIKYDNFIRIPRNTLNTVSLYSEAVPFTPTLFLHLIF